MNYQIFVVDDHPIVTEGICNLLEQNNLGICKGISQIEEVNETTLKNTVDLFILDLSFPGNNGFSLLNLIQQKCPKSKILIYTMHEEPWIINKLSQYTIHGAVSKQDPLTNLIQAVKVIRNGQKYFSTAFSILQKDVHPDRTYLGNVPVLSKREKEVLNYLTLGKSTSDIAEELYLSVNTIHTYRKRLMAKLEAKNVAELVYKGKDFF